MPLYQASRIEVLDDLVSEVQHLYPKGRIIVAVDGRDGAGQRAFADALAERFAKAGTRAFTASVDDFQQPRAVRERQGRDSVIGRYEDRFDDDDLKRALIEPFRLGGSTGFVTEYFDAARDTEVVDPTWHTAGADAVLIVSGEWLLRPEIRGLWHYTIWLEADVPADGAQELYERREDPRRKVHATIVNDDPAQPRRRYSDSC